MTSGLRAASPADAKAVWDSMAKPSTRRVADALMQAGFAKISHKSILRWQSNGWALKERGGHRQPALIEAQANVDTSVPVLTGTATTRLRDLVPPSVSSAEQPQSPPTQSAGDDAAAIGVAPVAAAPTSLDRSALDKMTDDHLMKTAAREAYITTVMLLRRVQERIDLVETMPRELGSLQAALAGSLVAANGAFDQLLKLQDKLLEPRKSREPDGGDDNELEAAIAAFQSQRGKPISG